MLFRSVDEMMESDLVGEKVSTRWKEVHKTAADLARKRSGGRDIREEKGQGALLEMVKDLHAAAGLGTRQGEERLAQRKKEFRRLDAEEAIRATAKGQVQAIVQKQREGEKVSKTYAAAVAAANVEGKVAPPPPVVRQPAVERVVGGRIVGVMAVRHAGASSKE